MSVTERPSDTGDIVFPSPEVSTCPYPMYQTLRDEGPVHRVPGVNQWGGKEYVVTRYDDIVEIMRTPKVFSNVTFVVENFKRRLVTPEERAKLGEDSISTFQGADPPRHTWKRKIAAKHLLIRPGSVAAHRPIVEQVIDELIDGFVDDDHVEFITQFARPAGARATMRILGMPADDAVLGERWGSFEGQAIPYHTTARQALIAEDVHDMQDYVMRAVVDRHEHPRPDDIVSAFVAAHVEHSGPELGLQHARADLSSVMLGGMGTSAHLIGNVMTLLLDNPDTMRAARASRHGREHVVEETLRLDSPVQWNVRMALRDYDLNGTTIEAGSLVMVLFGSGNRDERQFPDPEQVNLERKNERTHLAFGFGLHFCVGAPLARLIAQTAFEKLFARTDQFAYAGEVPTRLDSLAFRGNTRLDLTFEKI